MKSLNKIAALFSLAVCFGAACEQPKSSGAANSSGANATAVGANANSRSANSSNGNSADASASTLPNSAVDAKEPEKYRATVTLKLETSGAQQQTMPFPPIKAEVARSGADRRLEFKLPTGETIVYLDKGGRQIVVSQQKKQYAELNKESVGFDVQHLLMPEQIVSGLKNMKGAEQVGEETVDGRAALKYRIASSADTQSQAGRVEQESYILVDKETGLPLRSFTDLSAQGNVRGVNALNLVTEMSDISTDVDPALFSEPTDFQKVAPEQIRGQLNAVLGLATAFLGQMLKSSSAAATAPSPNGSATP